MRNLRWFHLCFISLRFSEPLCFHPAALGNILAIRNLRWFHLCSISLSFSEPLRFNRAFISFRLLESLSIKPLKVLKT